MLVDFTDIKRSLRTWINDQLDHRMILHRDLHPGIHCLAPQCLANPNRILDPRLDATLALAIFASTQHASNGR